MKKLLATTLITTFLAASAVAVAGPGKGGCGGFDGQKGGFHSGGRGDMVTHLDRVVGLTDAQKAELTALQEDMRADRANRDKPAREMMNLDSTAADYQAQVNALADAAAERARERVLRHGEKHAKVQAILTEEQRAKLKEFHEDRAEFKGKWRK